MAKILNGTTHEIVFYNEADCQLVGRKLILKPGSVPVYKIPSGSNLNAQTGTSAPPKLDVPFPVTGGVVFVGYDPIPPDADIVVVSNLYRSAVKELGGDTSRLATVSGTIYDSEESLRPCGCLSLAIG